MHEGFYAAGREFGVDVAGEESVGFVMLLQHGVKVRDRESSDEQVGLFAGAELVEKKPNVRNAARDGGFGSSGPLFRIFAVSTSELGRDEFGVIQSRNDIAMAG